MRNFVVLLVIVLCFPTCAFSKGLEKEYVKMIKEYDISTSAKEAENLSQFWDLTMSQNERVALLFKAEQRNTRLFKRAYKKLWANQVLFEYRANRFYYVSDYNNVLSELEKDLGVNYGADIFVVNRGGGLNAYSDSKGEIYIEEDLILADDLTYEMLLGICAHEYAHYLMSHIKNGYYQAEKREKRNNIIATISAGLDIAGASVAAANGVKTEGLDERVAGYYDSAKEDARMSGFKYSREQEVEADIIAYRFLDYIGIGGEKYIDALKLLLRKQVWDFSSDESNHPSLRYRIGLLEYLKAHPEIVRNTPKHALGRRNGFLYVIK